MMHTSRAASSANSAGKKLAPKQPATEARQLQETVLANGYCVGCGACAAVAGSPFEVRWDAYGRLVAEALSDPDASPSRVLHACPFSADNLSEDRLGLELFGSGALYDARIGYYRLCLAGYVATGDYRERGSSGGVGRWLAAKLLKDGLVDYVAHVEGLQAKRPEDPLFAYAVTSDPETVKSGAHSAYYPVEISRVLATIRAVPGRYALTGLPCFIKAIRQLCRVDSVLKARVAYTIGIVCGHLKSANYARLIGWQQGVPPNDLTAIDFREKILNRPANHKGNRVWARGESVGTLGSSRDLYGTDYGLGLFKLKACDYCDDVLAETADVSVGDAWLSPFVEDSLGTSVIVVRSAALDALVRHAMTTGDLCTQSLDADAVAESQAAGLRHRREGLAFRLTVAGNQGAWYPPKRQAARPGHAPGPRDAIYRLRVLIAEQSHDAFLPAWQQEDLDGFIAAMAPLIAEYRRLYHGPHEAGRVARALNRARRLLRSFRSS